MRMLKSNFIKKIIFLLGIFIINIKETYAFYSPTSLQLLAASVGPIIKNLLIIVITAIISMGITKKKNKKRILTFAIALFFVLVLILTIRYLTLKSMNQPSVTVSDLKKLSYESLKSNKPENIEADQEFMQSHFVDLNNISIADYDDFKVIMLEHNPEEEFYLRNSIYVPSTELWSVLKENKSTFKEFLHSINYSLNDKYLFVCHHGTMSSIIAYLSLDFGLDSYYSSLVSMENEELLFGDFIENANKDNSVIIKKFFPEKKDEKYIIFIFGTDEAHYLCSEDKFSLIASDLSDYFEFIFNRIIAVEASKYGKEQFLEECEIKFSDQIDTENKNSKILCLYPLHCLLTQHHLNYLNLSTSVKEIYRIGEIENQEYTQLYEK